MLAPQGRQGQAPVPLAVIGRNNAGVSLAADGDFAAASWGGSLAGAQDVFVSVSRNGGAAFAEPVRVSEDHWEFDGCPDNGPAIAVDASKRVHVAWPSPADVKDARSMALWYAMWPAGSRFESWARRRLASIHQWS